MTTQAYEDLLRAVKEAYAYYLTVCKTVGDFSQIPAAPIFFLLGEHLVEALQEAIGPFQDGDILREVMMQYAAEQKAANL